MVTEKEKPPGKYGELEERKIYRLLIETTHAGSFSTNPYRFYVEGIVAHVYNHHENRHHLYRHLDLIICPHTHYVYLIPGRDKILDIEELDPNWRQNDSGT